MQASAGLCRYLQARERNYLPFLPLRPRRTLGIRCRADRDGLPAVAPCVLLELGGERPPTTRPPTPTGEQRRDERGPSVVLEPVSAPVDFQRAIRAQVDSPLRVLFPEDVIVVSATGTARPPPLLPAEEPFVRHAVEKRRREFASGRACAREALARMGLPELPLLPGKRK